MSMRFPCVLICELGNPIQERDESERNERPVVLKETGRSFLFLAVLLPFPSFEDALYASFGICNCRPMLCL